MITSILKDTDKRLYIVIKSRKKTFFDGDAVALSSINDNGPFDVLPAHANFITMIRDFIKITINDSTAQEFAIKTGVMRVYENRISVYLTVA